MLYCFLCELSDAQGMNELVKGTEEKLSGALPRAEVFAHQLPFNLIPHIDSFQVSYLFYSFFLLCMRSFQIVSYPGFE